VARPLVSIIPEPAILSNKGWNASRELANQAARPGPCQAAPGVARATAVVAARCGATRIIASAQVGVLWRSGIAREQHLATGH
jgi:hypothetical protein